MPILTTFSDAVLPQKRIEQVKQGLRSSLAIHLYTKDLSVNEFFLALFHDKDAPLTIMNWGRYLQFVSETNQA